jgi:hypothetical protein
MNRRPYTQFTILHISFPSQEEEEEILHQQNVAPERRRRTGNLGRSGLESKLSKTSLKVWERVKGR